LATQPKRVAASDNIEGLNDYKHVRLRMEMYFGGRVPVTESIVGWYDGKLEARTFTFVPAVLTAFREILDNALDEVIGHGHGDRIDVTYDPTNMVFSVADNGNGIPFDKVEMVFSTTKSGRNFGERGEVAGTNGIGASGVNLTSQWFEVEVRRDGKKYVQRFTEADGVLAIDELIVGAPKKTAGSGSGTKVTFKPSPSAFPHQELPEAMIRGRIAELAAINPRVKFTYNGEQFRFHPKLEKSFFRDFNPIVLEVDEKVTVSMMVSKETKGKAEIVAVEKEVPFRSAFYLVPKFSQGNEEQIHSVVNNIAAYNGGTHITAFRSVFYNGLLRELERESRRRKLQPNRSDVAEGLLIFNVTRMTAPNFDSQSKTRLTNAEAEKAVRRHLEGEIAFKKIIREHPEWIEQIYERCEKRTHRQDMSEVNKAQRKMSAKIAKLRGAIGRDRSKCILFIGEGDSAIEGMAAARNAEIHGGLPLRGKIMNVHGERPSAIIDSTALADLMAAIGLKMGERAIRSGLNYGKVYIATDEDEDGKNILALLVNFFYTYWPELFDPQLPPYVFKFDTPFIILRKGKENKYFYGRNYHDFKPSEWKGWSVTRAKGLGALQKKDWEHCLEKPSLTPLVADDKSKEALDLIFNNDRADDRKEWIGL
jgi:DNA gyrase/topoisomerase IV subunit B